MTLASLNTVGLMSGLLRRPNRAKAREFHCTAPPLPKSYLIATPMNTHDSWLREEYTTPYQLIAKENTPPQSQPNSSKRVSR